MSTYVIAELKPGETGGFAPRGAVKRLWQTRDFATIVAGPAETGKTWGCLQYVDALLWKYPGAQGVMARKVYSWLIGSAVRTYQRVIGPDSPIKPFGGEHPQWFDYPNGSRLWVAGLDNPGKALSSERDFIYINQAEEMVLDDFAVLTTRCTGRGALMPYTRIFGDANPGPPKHWIKQREADGELLLLESRHVDNPTLYDDAGNITEQGKRTMKVLDALPGVLRARLRDGRWVGAEGTVYESWDSATHLKDQKWWDRSRRKRTIGGVDWGYSAPGCLQAWDIDGDGRMVEVCEVYRTKRTIDWWITKARWMRDTFGVQIWICDPSEPSFIEQFNNAGLNAIPAFNDILPGILNLAQRLPLAGDGQPRFFVLRSALTERDEDLVQASQPTSLAEEMDVYAWPKAMDGKPIKEVPIDAFNHAEDPARYVAAYVDGLGGVVKISKVSSSAFAISK